MNGNLYDNTATTQVVPAEVIRENMKAHRETTLSARKIEAPKPDTTAKTKPVETKVITPTEETETVYVFNSCGTRWQFKEAEWYPTFVNKLITTPKLTNAQGRVIFENNRETYSALSEVLNEYGMLREMNVAYICADNTNGLALIMLNGNTQEGGGMMRYDFATKKLAKATQSPAVGFHIHQFGPRAGEVIVMPSGLRTDECTSTFKVDYDFVANTLTPIRECKTCGNEAEVCSKLLEVEE